MSLTRACSVADVAAESAIPVEVEGVDVAVVHSGDRFYAIADECSHAAIPLSEGDVGEGEIECYLHGSRFDLATGEPLGLPATEPVAVYRCRVVGDDVLVDLTATPDTPEAVLRTPGTPEAVLRTPGTPEAVLRTPDTPEAVLRTDDTNTAAQEF